MAAYKTFELVPSASPDAEPPEGPRMADYAENRAATKQAFLRALLEHADDEHVQMNTELPRLGRVIILLHVIKRTAGLLVFARHREPPAQSSVLISAVLLSGYADADNEAMERLNTTPGFANNPHLDVEAFEAARDQEPPVMVQCFSHADCYMDVPLRILCDAFGDAFFEQFGHTDEADEGDGPPDGPH